MRNAEGGTANAATRALAAVAALALVTACTPDEGEPLTLPSPTASASTAPAPSPAVEEDDPFAVPAEIDEAYVERVLNEINRINADLTRDILRRPLDPDATALPSQDLTAIERIYAEPILTFNGRFFLELTRDENERGGLLPPDEYGQLRTPVVAIIATDPCLVAIVDQDFSETDAVPERENSSLAIVFLVPNEGGPAPGWKLARLLNSDAPPGSADEQEVRETTIEDISEFMPEVCA